MSLISMAWVILLLITLTTQQSPGAVDNGSNEQQAIYDEVEIGTIFDNGTVDISSNEQQIFNHNYDEVEIESPIEAKTFQFSLNLNHQSIVGFKVGYEERTKGFIQMGKNQRIGATQTQYEWNNIASGSRAINHVTIGTNGGFYSTLEDYASMDTTTVTALNVTTMSEYELISMAFIFILIISILCFKGCSSLKMHSLIICVICLFQLSSAIDIPSDDITIFPYPRAEVKAWNADSKNIQSDPHNLQRTATSHIASGLTIPEETGPSSCPIEDPDQSTITPLFIIAGDGSIDVDFAADFTLTEATVIHSVKPIWVFESCEDVINNVQYAWYIYDYNSPPPTFSDSQIIPPPIAQHIYDPSEVVPHYLGTENDGSLFLYEVEMEVNDTILLQPGNYAIGFAATYPLPRLSFLLFGLPIVTGQPGLSDVGGVWVNEIQMDILFSLITQPLSCTPRFYEARDPPLMLVCTSDPTVDPTIDPTIDPTMMPTIPTLQPTIDPTMMPTIPTLQPTNAPTGLTDSPTTDPTDSSDSDNGSGSGDNGSDSGDNGSGSGDSSDNNIIAAKALFNNENENKELNNDTNNGTTGNETVIMKFSENTLMMLWTLFGVLMIVNIIWCIVCFRKKKQKGAIVEELSTIYNVPI